MGTKQDQRGFALWSQSESQCQGTRAKSVTSRVSSSQSYSNAYAYGTVLPTIDPVDWKMHDTMIMQAETESLSRQTISIWCLS